MHDYRLYLVDRVGHIKSVLELECEDAEDALSKADQARNGLRAELWLRAKHLHTFEGRDAAHSHD